VLHGDMVTRLLSEFCDTARQGTLWRQVFTQLTLQQLAVRLFVISPAGEWLFLFAVWHK
jgi:hypothetical protein